MKDRFLLGIGLVYSLLLSFTLLRNLILPPGLVLYGDMIWPVAPEAILLPFYSWQFLVSAPQWGNSFAPIYLMILLTQNVELVEKSLILFTFSVLSFSAFYMTHFLTREKQDSYRLIMCLSAATLILLNPFVYSRFLGQLSMLWGFGLAPLIFVLFVKGLEDERMWKRYMVLAALLLTFSSINLHAGVWTIFLLGCYLVYYLILSKKKVYEVLQLLKKPTLFFATYTGLTAYWLFPQVLMYQGGHPIFAFTVDTVNSLSSRSFLLDVMRLHGINLGVDMVLDPILHTTNAPLLLMTFIPVLLSFSAILFRPKDRMVVFFTSLLPLILFLGQGTQGPFGDAYIWLVFHSPISNVGWLLRDPNRVVGLLVISYAYLSAVAISEICKHLEGLEQPILGYCKSFYGLLLHYKLRKVRYLPAFIIIILFFSSISLGMVPMLQGTFSLGQSSMSPVKVPDEYVKLNEWVRKQEGHFKVLWMPYDRGQFQYVWNRGAGISNFPTYASSRPSMYMIFSGIDATRFLTYTYYGSLLRNGTSDFGKIISIMNMQYIVYHEDYASYVSYYDDDPITIHRSLIMQRDLKWFARERFSLPSIDSIYKSNALQILIAFQKRLYLLGGGKIWSMDSEGVVRLEVEDAGYGYGAHVFSKDGYLYISGGIDSQARIYRVMKDYSIETVFEAPTAYNPAEFFAIEEFNNELYAGAYMSPNGVTVQGSLYRSPSGDPGTWTEIKRWATSENQIVRSLKVWEGYLWIGGTFSGAAPLIKFDGTTYTTAYVTALSEIDTIEVYGGRMYFGGGMANYSGRLYSTADGRTFREDLKDIGHVYKLKTFAGKLLIVGGDPGWQNVWIEDPESMSSKVLEYDGAHLRTLVELPECLTQAVEVFDGKTFAATTGYGVLYEISNYIEIEDFMKVFENNYDSEPLFIPSGMMLLVGGLDGYVFLNTFDSFKPTDWGIIYAERSPSLSMEHLTNSDILLFFNRDFDDLLFGLLNKDDLIQLAEPIVTQDPYSGWASYGVSPADLLQIWNFIGEDGISPDVASSLDFGRGYVFTFKEDARLDSRFTVRSTEEYDLWARVLLHPNGGRIGFQVDNQQIIPIDTYSQQDKGFTWVNIAKVTLSQGEHKMSIINSLGKNAINLLATISTTDSANVQQKAQRLIEQSSSRIFYVFDDEKLNRDDSVSEVTKLSKSLFIPKGGNYSLFVQAGVNGSFEVEVDAITQRLSDSTNSGLKWIYIGSFDLSSGEHTLRFTLDNSTLNRIILSSTSDEKADNFNEFFSMIQARATITDYEIIDHTSLTVTVNSSKPFLLVLTESFNPLWSLSSSDEDASSIPIYSFLNGFLVNKTGNMTLFITYKPQQLQTLSMYVSGFSLLVTLSYLSALALKPIFKRPKNIH